MDSYINLKILILIGTVNSHASFTFRTGMNSASATITTVWQANTWPASKNLKYKFKMC